MFLNPARPGVEDLLDESSLVFAPHLHMQVQRTLKSLRNVQLLAFNHQQDMQKVAHSTHPGAINL